MNSSSDACKRILRFIGHLPVLVLCAASFVITSAHATGREPLPVVATFSILGDMVKEIGGDRVRLTTIVGVNSDTHNFEATPGDARALQHARVLVLNGLDFEPWLNGLLEASGFKGQQVLASKGVKVRVLGDEVDSHDHSDHEHAHGPHDQHGAHDGHDHHAGDVDPHAWQDLANGMVYARNIAAGLGKADPRNASYYEGRAESYIARMQALDTEIRAALAAIPRERRKVITSHDAFGYFGDAYGVDFIAVAGLSSRSEPSARELARIITQAREAGVRGVFVENMSNASLINEIARETGAIVGGTLYSDALGPADEPAGTYLGMLSWNAGRLVYVLKRARE